ncbi:Uncharacterised protein [Mycobacteroides abscessus subsp. massiliense]|nr:Uncharacterised protein [Mycobacteroides abscessus subsp. massiliense]
MFKEPAENGSHRDVAGEFRNARSQRADPAHHHLDGNTGLRCPVQRIDDLLVHQRVHFHSDAGILPGPMSCDLLVDAVDDPRANSVRCH